MKTKQIVLSFLCIAMTSMSSCKKEEYPEKQNQEIENLKSIGDFVENPDEIFKENMQESKDLLAMINGATSYDDIPTTNFSCHSFYKYTYHHLKQPDNQSCSWTSYVICAGNIANTAGKFYGVTIEKVARVKEECNNSKMITALRDYANTKDKYFVQANIFSFKKSSTTYLTIIKHMILMMYYYKTPFITIAKAGNVGHYVTVYSVHWKQGLTGSLVYFMDSLDPNYGSFNANIKSMDLELFLEKMNTNSNQYYNFLRILP